MAGVSETGFTKLTVEEVLLEIQKEMRIAFGNAFDMTPEGPDGQQAGIIARFLADQWTMAEAVFNAYNPAAVSGVGLDNLVRLNGISRISGQPSTAAVYLDGTPGVSVPKGSTVSTVDGIEYTTNEDVILPKEVAVTAKAVSTTPIGAGQINTIVDQIAGWNSVVNNEDAVRGILEETDAQLRARRERSVIRTGTSTVEAIYAGVADLNLEYIAILENDTDATKDGIPPNSFHVIAEGGTSADIARRIYNNKPAGIQAFGAVNVDVVDSQGYSHPIGFSRPASKLVKVTCTLRRPEGRSLDGPAKVQAALVDYINKHKIAEDVVWANLFRPATDIDGVEIHSITVGFDGDVEGTSNLSVGVAERVHTSVLDVLIVEV